MSLYYSAMASRGDQVFEAVVSFPGNVVLPGDIAGLRLPVTIGTVHADLVLPEFEVVPDGPGQTRPVPVPPEVECVKPNVDWSEVLRSSFPWASAYQHGLSQTGGPGAVGSFWLHHFLVRATFRMAPEPEAMLERMASAFAEGIGPWLERLLDWLELGSGRDLRSPYARREGGYDAYEAWGYDGARYRTLANRQFVLSVTLTEAIGSDIWHASVAKASSGARIPLEYRFLHSARHSARARDYRMAVLDAATATEVAMASIVQDQMESIPDSMKDSLQKKSWTLSVLAEVLRALEIDFPNDLRNKGLAEPRNRAIHRGGLVSEQKAYRAIQIAAQMVKQANPPAPLLAAHV